MSVKFMKWQPSMIVGIRSIRLPISFMLVFFIHLSSHIAHVPHHKVGSGNFLLVAVTSDHLHTDCFPGASVAIHHVRVESYGFKLVHCDFHCFFSRSVSLIVHKHSFMFSSESAMRLSSLFRSSQLSPFIVFHQVFFVSRFCC